MQTQFWVIPIKWGYTHKWNRWKCQPSWSLHCVFGFHLCLEHDFSLAMEYTLFFFFLVCLCMSLSFVIFVLLLALMFSFCVCFISCIFPVLDVINEWNVLQPFKLSWLSWLLKTYWLLVRLVTSKMFLTVSKRVEWNWWGQVFVLCWLWLTFRYLRNGWPVS